MHTDIILLIILATIAGAAVPLAAWFRAQRRIRHLEMTLLAEASDADRYEDLRALIQQLAAQTEQLADGQAQLAHRLSERLERPLLPRPESSRPVTPH